MNLVGHFSLLLALATAGWSLVAAVLGVVGKGRGLQLSAERALLATFGLVTLATALLLAGFLRNDFSLEPS